jgi:hypothetical protein
MPPHRARRTSRRPLVEGLESRCLLSANGSRSPHVAIAATRVTSLIQQLPTTPQLTASTIPADGAGAGDLNPYGVAFVPKGFPKGGPLRPGDILVANFNNSQNLQGTGTTIVQVTPQGAVSTFYQNSQTPGLDTALGILRRGFIIVGSLPTTDGTSDTVQPGMIQVLDRTGKQVATLSDPNLLDGPWDLTVDDRGATASVFVANVLSGAVSRFDLSVPARGNNLVLRREVQIASGYGHRADPAALVLGPTGLAFDARRDVLYVASTLDNEIFAVPNAERLRSDQGTGVVVYNDPAHLHGPIGLALAPNGNLIAANADAVNADPNQNSEIVEFTPKGQFVAQFSLDAAMPAAPFGIAINTVGRTTSLAAVNDDTNQLEVFSATARR